MPDPRKTRGGRVLPIIRQVRARWRLRVAVRGLSLVLAVGFLAFLLSAFGLEATRFSPPAVTALRFAAWLLVLAVAGLFLLRPLLRRISDEQVALYLEEKEPSLEAAILGAVSVEKGEKGGSGARGGSHEGPSPALLGLLVERAVEKARSVEYGRRIERRGLYRGFGVLGFVSAAILLFALLGPSGLRYGMTSLVLPTTEAAAVSPYAIGVTPGDASIARGADLLVTARLRGFDSDRVYLFSRTGEGEAFQQLSMLPADSGSYELLLLNMVEETEYFVEANGVRSPSFTIEVADLPYVARMSHTYHFPVYTGLAPREVEDAGDIAALGGTRVELAIEPTIPSPGGRVLVDDSVVAELRPMADGTLSGEIHVRADGVYRVELSREDGRMVDASPEYTIDVLSDLPPTVAISEPGRDAAASAVEEIFIEARADDDYGVGALSLVYSVNGQPEDTVSLFTMAGSPMQEVSAGYTLFLEEWALDPGDVVSYYAVASDARRAGASTAMSDIYFVNIRPFRRDFRQAEQQQQQGGQPMGGGMGGGGGQNGLSELQREVVAATFNLLRDRDSYLPETFTENAVSVALAQGRVRDEVANLVVQMTTRGVADSHPRFQEIAELLPRAVADMEAAEALLREENPGEALAPEQRALTVLQKAEETYERYVGQQEQQGGGGGGQGGASAEELADLFELELDRLQNQYETVQRGERQQADEDVDALMERLKELARRQQQELERQRARADAGQAGQGGSGGQAQRALADEVEETARQLAELSRRTGDQRLAETARRLQDAAESMRRSAAGSGQTRGVTDATSALDDLEEAQRRLERSQEDRMGAGIQDALDRVNRLAEAQEEVRGQVEEIPENPFDRGEEVERIHQMKDAMALETEALERDLVRLQQGAQAENREAATELNQAVEAIREGRLSEKLAYTKGVVEQRERDFALEWEDQIRDDIEALRQEVEAAARAFAAGQPDREMQEALEAARELVRGTGSLERRLQSRGRAGEGQGADEREQGEAGRAEDPGGDGRQGQGDGAGRGAGDRQQDSLGGQEGRQAGGGDATGRQGTDPEGDPRGEAGESASRLREGVSSGGATRGDPEPLSEEEIRQFSREFGERLAQARELRDRLAEAGREIPELEEAMDAMARLQDPESYGDLPQVAALQERIRENLLRLEFQLRREVEGDGPGRAALTGSDEVPPGFRRMVEEYFRNLARRGGGGGGR